MSKGHTHSDPHGRLNLLAWWLLWLLWGSGGTSQLSRVKLRDGEEDRRSPWTTFLLPLKLIAADKWHANRQCRALAGQTLHLRLLTVGRTDARLVTAALRKTHTSQKYHCLCLSRVKIWMRAKQRRTAWAIPCIGSCLVTCVSLSERFCDKSLDYMFAGE